MKQELEKVKIKFELEEDENCPYSLKAQMLKQSMSEASLESDERLETQEDENDDGPYSLKALMLKHSRSEASLEEKEAKTISAEETKQLSPTSPALRDSTSDSTGSSSSSPFSETESEKKKEDKTTAAEEDTQLSPTSVYDSPKFASQDDRSLY